MAEAPPVIHRKSYTTSAAASGWVGGELSFGNKIFELINVEISLPSSVDYALPAYLEWEYHSGLHDAKTFSLGNGSAWYRRPFVIQGPVMIAGPGKILSGVYHHSTSHSHYVKARYREVHMI